MAMCRIIAIEILTLITLVGTKQQFAREPSNEFVNMGDSVTFPCRIRNQVGIVQWTRDGFGLGLGKNLHGFVRYKIVGRTDEGDWSLSISPVELEDEAEFQCQVGGAEGQNPIRSRKVRLVVKVAPEPPRILQVDSSGTLSFVAGDILKLTCISKGGKPAAIIKWKIGNTEVKERILSSSELESNGFRYTTISTFEMKVDKSSHEKIITCEAQNGAENLPQEASVKVMVKFKPIVKIKRVRELGSTGEMLKEGEKLKLACEANGNPSKFQFSWKVDGHKVNGDLGSWSVSENIFTIPAVTRELRGRRLSCQVSNSVGLSEDQIKLNVAYGPQDIVVSGSKTGLEGEQISLSCLTDSNPSPSITWYKISKTSELTDYGANMTFSINRETEGKYICEANTAGFAKLSSKPVQVLLLRKPLIISADEIFYGDLAATAQIVCVAEMSPHKAKISWSFKGEELTNNGEKYEMVPSESPPRVQSKLIIKKTEEDNFGTYQCTVSNNLGKDVALMELRKKGALTSGSLFLSCLLGVGLTVFIIGLVYWIRRYFNLNQFYPQHIKLFSKTELETPDEKRNGFNHQENHRNGRKGSKDQASPCSSEVFFQHFNKRKANSNCEQDIYNPLIKSPVEDQRPVKTCSHPLIKQASANSETKSCQTLPSDPEKSFLEKNKNHDNGKIPDLTRVLDMAPDITQVTSQSVLENKNIYSDSLPPVNNVTLNGYSMEHNSSKSNGGRHYDKESAEQAYRKIRDTASSRSKSSSRPSKHLNNSYTDPYLDQTSTAASCYHQPAVNYYANSIYLGRDIPVYVPSTDNQLYNNFYALESSGGNTSNTPYLDYYYNGRQSTQDSDIAYHDYSPPEVLSSTLGRHHRLKSELQEAHSSNGYGQDSSYSTWNYRQKMKSNPDYRSRRKPRVPQNHPTNYILGLQDIPPHKASHV